MSEEMRLIVGTPTVTGTKIGKLGEVRIQADDGPGGDGISVHYILASENTAPPAVREKLLVAIVEGAYPQWLEDDGPGRERPEITFEAESANGNNRVVRLIERPSGGWTRAQLSTFTRSTSTGVGAPTYDVLLSKGQVTSLIMTLLALYPRLHEV